MSNILEEKGITEERLENMLEKYTSKNVRLVNYEAKLYKEGVQYDIYKILINYQVNSGTINHLPIVAKVYKGVNSDWFGEEKERNEIVYENRVAEYLKGNEYIVKSLGIGPYNDIFLMEDLGEDTLEKEFVKSKEKNILKSAKNQNLIERTFLALISIHKHLDEKKIGNVPLQEHYTKKLCSYLKSIFAGKGKELPQSLLDKIKENFEPIDKYLTRGAIGNEIELDVIHSDFHASHIFIDSMKVIDFRLTIAPAQFDIVDLLEHPLVYNIFDNPRKKIENFLIEYKRKIELSAIKDSLKLRNLTHKEIKDKLGENGVEILDKIGRDRKEILTNNFLDIYYLSGMYRGIRAAAKSFSLEQKYPNLYEKLVENNPLYPKYRIWYLSHLKELFETIKKENGMIPNKDMEHLTIFYNILAENIEEINSNYEFVKTNSNQNKASVGI